MRMLSNSLRKLGSHLGLFVKQNRRCTLQGVRNSSVESCDKLMTYIYDQRVEQNPEYHGAPRCYVQNFLKHQYGMHYEERKKFNEHMISSRNPRYRWTDFRRRMIYGAYDV